MPITRDGQPVSPWMARQRGMRRLSALTAGVGVAGVLAAGGIAFALPGPTHGTTTGSASSTAPTHATSGASGTAGGSTATSGSNTSGSRSGSSATSPSGDADATSGAS